MAEIKFTVEYRGYTIAVLDNLRFSILMEDDDEWKGHNKHFNSAVEAREQIDTLLKLKQSNEKKVIERRVLTPDGEEVTATKVHSGQGNVLLRNDAGKAVEVGSRTVYPVNDWVRDLLIAKRAAQDVIDKINVKLRGRVGVDTSVCYGRITDADRYNELIDRWVANLDEAEKVAKERAAEWSREASETV